MEEFFSNIECISTTTTEKTINHYNSSHKILLVGEGDFSFSACLATAFASASNILATSLDSKVSLLVKYSRASRNLKILEELGGRVLHGVDATSMSRHPLLYDMSFDRIIFNFPHAGFILKETDPTQIELHRSVVRGFLENAKELISENGEIHITHKTSHPFNKWEIVNLAEEEGLHLIEEADFRAWMYPNYENKRGNGLNSDGTFPVGAASTFKFARTTIEY